MSRSVAEVAWEGKLVLCGESQDVLAAWHTYFDEYPDVEIRQGDIFSSGCRAFLCPGNSFGFMDRGPALEALEALGWELQDQLRTILRERFDGELLVGQAVLLQTGGNPAWMVYAPLTRTAATPSGTINYYLALRGAFLVLRDHNRDAGEGEKIDSLAVPDFGTETAEFEYYVSARQVHYALQQATGQRGRGGKNLSRLTRREIKLRSVPKKAMGPTDETDGL